MKPTPVRSRLSATCSGLSMILAPSSSRTSALPDEEEALRPPCLAIFTPWEADTNMAAVEILKVLEPSPPVPHISSRRSEEHTSELQSLMRISYAVFCLKKKNTKYDSKELND